ncbi:crossover junction endodeoxyribonuclease RuvC [Candidatus Roizmanbacteria bacterium CG_4_10_14_0_8_um_filter_39_9]|uniref:Crossover junction endodeoxyribonuclease RuvC n=1 Tax=Candidatus Roizmanbacteria bacterium CG_4_10_14_0_8_um_filter_39_9 TaxID=1974829 RepID=A0A2M7QEG5_9BACT|nr:MAG: crossover junction endodeoxyribonuclease RuvC [Candidatus Roizmanbacteria bacterium CG_4_10_14_0_8_um_filter_39_9]
MIILSLDPGVERTGFALFNKKDQNNFKYLTSGLVETSKTCTLPERLKSIYDTLAMIVLKYKPSHVVIERLFFSNNQKTAIAVAQAQGIILLLAQQMKIDLSFLTPPQIKEIVTGYGGSDKKSVQKMLGLLDLKIPKNDLKQDDQADAIACGYAICCLPM